MEKYSVKKPFTILVMVLTIIILGIVSLTSMTTDLLPDINLPYMIVVTTYPGASPEKVESDICEPMESALGSVNGVKNVMSVANENYGIVELEFEDGTDMDSAMVKVSSALDPVKDILPEECGTPSLMEIGTDMMATQYLSIGYEDMSIEELTAFVEDTVVPRLERQNGVTSISSIGMVEKTIQVELNQEKVDKINDKILAKTNDAFADAVEQLDEAKQQIIDGQNEIDENKKKMQDSEKELADGKQELIDGQKELEDGKQELIDKQKELDDAKQKLQDGKNELENKKNETYNKLAQASLAADQLSAYQAQLVQQQASMEATEEILKQIKTLEESNTVQALTTVLQTIDTLSASLVQGDDAALVEQQVVALQQFATQMLQVEALDKDTKAILKQLSEVSVSTTVGEAKTILANLKKAVESSKQQAESVIASKADYEASLASIQLQIQVTQSIIAQYEAQLQAAGMTYEEIEKLKLQAAEGFGAADAELSAGETSLSGAQTQLDAGKESLEDAQKQIDSGWESIEEGQKQLEEGKKSLEDAQEQIDDSWEEYEQAVRQYEKQREEAIKQANAEQLIAINTLSQLIYAQNFAMPAGYIDDKYDNSWLVKVGDHYKSLEELENVLLANIEDVGDIRLKDVADLTIIDNSLESYARLNGGNSIILSVFKSSTVGTNEVSRQIDQAISELQEENPGLDVVVLMDQGDYITLLIKSVLQNIIVGAILAIIILALFLKDVKPTLVVAMSIPLSVLLALILMYFTDISLNMMSLSGLALGIGMLVDNSIVVIENIYRLRMKGISAARAAVQGTKQVAGAITASTLTSICVFFPMIFSTGIVKELMMPISLTIIYTLGASLLIAMTLVPAAGSTLLKASTAKEHPLFEKVQEAYGKALDFCLSVKVVPLTTAIVLFAFTVWQVVQMGVVMVPEMTSSQIQASVTMPKEMTREECYAMADEITERILAEEKVGSVGVMSGGEASLFSSAGAGGDQYDIYSFMIQMKDEKAGSKEVKELVKSMEASCSDLKCEISFSTGMGDMSALTGSGLNIKIYGDDLETLDQIGEDIIGLVSGVDGFEEVTDGQEEQDQVVHLVIDRDTAMRYGLSVAQIYADLSNKISNEKTAATVTMDGIEMDIKIVDDRAPLTYDTILDHTFDIQETDEDGDTITVERKLSEFAKVEIEDGAASVNRENQSRYLSITATPAEGNNVTLLSREVKPLIDSYELPDGYSITMGGEYESVVSMLTQMGLVLLLGLVLIYFVMVAQFQSLLSPFIVLFTVPLAFTGGLLGLLITREPLSVMAMMGFVILLGTVVNNGIVFVDYVNKLRMGGLERRDALIATGKTRMRPILMTAMTTILAMSMMLFGDDLSSQMGKGMAIVICGGLLYATLMTLFIIPVMYDILFKKQPLVVDVGSENLDDIPDDAADYLASKEEIGS